MDHLTWYPQSSIPPVQVPYVCGNEPTCKKDQFLDFATLQGWELKQSDSLAQLATRSQAWLFFGLLAVIGIPAQNCRASRASATFENVVNASILPSVLRSIVEGDDENNVALIVDVMTALARAEELMRAEVIPLIKEFEEGETLNLWSSQPYAILFSIEILIDTIVFVLGDEADSRRVSLFAQGMEGIEQSLLHVGKCRSLAHRLDNLRSSEFYVLLSFPSGDIRSDHSKCNHTSCCCFDVDQTSYRTRHVEDCVMAKRFRLMKRSL
ncbi:uncharacterized protein LY89DRAFT_124868 [Mollisia scopiformis]|uniref:Uncharacterized protein n=1 Tax=Mollisia scopiformis TaxID=149040 RepID=A0A194X4D6_MOLSC|nr:uncharacterized protein LY89DRAFT_124868 [Mollisia scopiformis]KUJ14919.1 hypothetical protein LY89DRAFT_124868 [Mollisia scopiformis]